MPVPWVQYVLDEPLSVYLQGPWSYIRSYGIYAGAAFLARKYFAGSTNTWERNMHGKVVMVTGGTSGIGAAVVEDLARRGAQIVLLVRSLSDEFTVDYITDLRARTDNQLIYAEACDLADLSSVRKFATKWIDNAPVRRLDMVICAAGVATPPFKERRVTRDGVEEQWGVNYLAHTHLLNILSPALRAQPADRDVRVILLTCAAYVLADLDLADFDFQKRGYPSSRPWRVYGASKLALMTYGAELQRRCDVYERPDKNPNKVRVMMVDPGLIRTSLTRRFLTFGSLFGLLIYLLTWLFWAFILKTPLGGAQPVLHCAMSPEVLQGEGGKLFGECREKKAQRKEVEDRGFATALWEVTEKEVKALEVRSTLEKKKAEKAEKVAEKKEAKKGK
ncbi:hypothetical protein SAICODRAFT_60415 [Saitoella complicata NRRL Y-17804]|nr:uncharacterized protein SAICODRAFT_60415 [Saitoella complicata NRRL Y-17804]ODQ51267.1 hypothetical protein SAICODRAFT_60415 [Saitoella complicata NRRL Y-17804]